MKNIQHGGDWAGFQEEFGRPPLDFSASISPLGVPDGVRAAAAKALKSADQYPDPDCRALRAAIAEHEHVSSTSVLCGAGAADLIWRVALAIHPRIAYLQAPTFGEYRTALDQVNCAVTHDWQNQNSGLIILCNPNNPTGALLTKNDVLNAAQRGAPVLVDECFLDFTDNPSDYDVKSYIANYPNLLVLKAFTKLYAMAGFRLGYLLCGDSSLLQKISEAGPPWAVSSVAQAAGIAALEETAYVKRVRELVASERPWLMENLTHLGLQVVPGTANFLLFHTEFPIAGLLKPKGILVRSCEDFEGLDDCWIRIAVRTHEENKVLIRALEEVLS